MTHRERAAEMAEPCGRRRAGGHRIPADSVSGRNAVDPDHRSRALRGAGRPARSGTSIREACGVSSIPTCGVSSNGTSVFARRHLGRHRDFERTAVGSESCRAVAGHVALVGAGRATSRRSSTSTGTWRRSMGAPGLDSRTFVAWPLERFMPLCPAGRSRAREGPVFGVGGWS